MIPWLDGAVRRWFTQEPPPQSGGRRFGVRNQNSRYEVLDEPGQTLSSLFELPAKPALARVIFFNDLPEAAMLDGAAVALTSTSADRVVPRGKGGSPDPGLWRRVTFSHEGAGHDPVKLPLHADRFDLVLRPNPRESGRPEIFYSDWMPLGGPDREDGRGALLIVRAYAKERLRFSASNGFGKPAMGLQAHGHVISGNATAPPFEGTAQANDRVFACYGVECIGSRDVATVVGIGDSIVHSSCSTGEVSGFVAEACIHASTPALPIAFFNEAYPGRNSIGFHENGARVIEALRPRVAIIQTWSQCDQWSSEAAEIAFARSLALADHAVQRGCVPILATAAPVFAGQPEYDVHRARSVARVRAASLDGVRILDLDAIWGDGGSPNAYRPIYDCGDHMHANDLGCEVVAKVLAKTLSEILERGA